MKIKEILFLLLCWVLIMLTGCSEKNNDDNSNDFLMQYTSDYTIRQENDDGTVEISVIAPDFKTIIEHMIDNRQEREISIENIEDIVNKFPDCKKEYILIVDELSGEKIDEVFNSQVAEELIRMAIMNIDYEEEWSTEE